MSKRHISKDTLTNIGKRRIFVLTELSKEALSEGNADRARRYVTLARNIGMKTRTDIPKDFKYCKKCLIPLLPGTNCRVRLTGGKVVSTCGECGAIKRMPYIKERSQ
jgi:RNase P subunit RPR2